MPRKNFNVSGIRRLNEGRMLNLKFIVTSEGRLDTRVIRNFSNKLILTVGGMDSKDKEKAGSIYFIPIVLEDSWLSHTLTSLLAIPLVV